MGNEKLQALSRQYIRGEIAKPEYRQKRAKIINDTTGDSATEPSESVSATHTRDSASVNRQIDSSLIKKVGVISAVIFVSLIIVFIAM